MKSKFILVAVVIVAVLGIGFPAWCQTNSNGLAVSAKVAFLTGMGTPQLILTVHLINTSNHDLVVLTKGLQYDFSEVNVVGAPKTNQRSWTVGYNQPGVTYQGHLIVPSLSDLSPVTIRPNEEAIIQKVFDDNHFLDGITPDTKITVTYAISSDWANRFGTWSGSADAKPFAVVVK